MREPRLSNEVWRSRKEKKVDNTILYRCSVDHIFSDSYGNRL